jgi:hypothetical protein
MVRYNCFVVNNFRSLFFSLSNKNKLMSYKGHRLHYWPRLLLLFRIFGIEYRTSDLSETSLFFILFPTFPTNPTFPTSDI